ncbi:MAG: elongation factor P maturation arginine rhamnosyltransferase EarP [Nitrosospira sp.]|nr:elongation factor P maturation arginine rhamnosyltransferase EarP [Nitrosospira sp.]
MKQRWDIFCNVVDNFGDIGVCWRLARQLTLEHGLAVRLWVDDLASFARIVPDADPVADRQQLRGVEVCHWRQPFAGAEPADVVIEAFACELPETYITAMAVVPQRPLWINLEYLSAENWVTGCHRLPSPHPRLPLVKHFFFPGFVTGTGGLLREQGLLSVRSAFDSVAQAEFWQRLGVPARRAGELRISLFCYGSAPLRDLFAAWAASAVPVFVLLPVPQGAAVDAVAGFFGAESPAAGAVLQSGQLTVRLIPFLEQSEYDKLLWACDINFVRGEDSFVRAQWAARPFVWHIYPQADNAHQVKLSAFLDLYTAGMPADMAVAVRALWHDWNGAGRIDHTWPTFAAHQVALAQHGEKWAEGLCRLGDLASNLVRFSRNQI